MQWGNCSVAEGGNTIQCNVQKNVFRSNVMPATVESCPGGNDDALPRAQVLQLQSSAGQEKRQEAA